MTKDKNYIARKINEVIKEDREDAVKFYKEYVGDLPTATSPTGEKFIAGHNNALDAFRHAYTSGMMTMRHGELSSDILGQAYEMKNEWDNYNVPEEQKATSEQMKNNRTII